MKNSNRNSKAIRDALPFVALSDLPAEHKSVVMEVIAQALNEAEQAERGLVRYRIGPWSEEELQVVATHLQGKNAASWQNADELVVSLASRLSRAPADVKEKGKELGYAVAVDYAAARERLRQSP